MGNEREHAHLEWKPIVSVKIKKDEIFFGPGIAGLLTLVEECGSVKDACRRMNLSYTKGWKMVNRAEEQLGYEILNRQHGGKSGGGTTLTEEGRVLLHKYIEMEAHISEYASQVFYDLISKRD